MTRATMVVVLAAVVMALAAAVVATLVVQGPRAMVRSFHLLPTPRAHTSWILKVTQHLRTSWMVL